MRFYANSFHYWLNIIYLESFIKIALMTFAQGEDPTYWFWFMNIWLFPKMVDLDILILLLLHTYYLLWYYYFVLFVIASFFHSIILILLMFFFMNLSFICLLLYYLCTLHEIFLKISKISSVFYRVLNKLIVWNWKKRD